MKSHVVRTEGMGVEKLIADMGETFGSAAKVGGCEHGVTGVSRDARHVSTS